jgi:flagellar biosynthetic protein FliR
MRVAVPQSLLLALLLASVRAAAWLSICPPFAGRGLPGPTRALLSVGIALPIVPQLSDKIPVAYSTPGLLAEIVLQVVVGAALGFCTHLFIAAVQSAGSLIDLFGGFAVAFAFDPMSTSGNSVFGRFYNLTAIALLFTTGAHQVILAGFARSYRALPPGDGLSLERMQRLITSGIGEMMLAAVQIAGPLLVVLFLADLVLGLLSRVSPSLNAFGLGFPAKILLTLVVAGSALALLPGAVGSLTDRAVTAVLGLLGA